MCRHVGPRWAPTELLLVTDCLEAQTGGESINLATFKMKRRDAAHRRYLGAMVR